MKGFFSSSQVKAERPEAGLVPKCGACGLYKTCQSPKMEPYGLGVKSILVVGEAPGQTEDEQGRPFIGKAGQLLRQTLREVGFNLDQDAWTTNAIICRPPGNKTPDDKQIKYCQPNLTNSIALYKPRVILTLGRSALASVISPYWQDIGSLERWAGWKIPLESHWVVPTYHPSYLARMNNPMLNRLFSDHLEQAFSIKRDPPAQPDFKKRITLLYNDRDAATRLGDLDREGGWLVVDYETNCLKPEYPKSRIVSSAVSDGKTALSFLWGPESAKALGRLLASPKTCKIASNQKFEERWTRYTFGHGVRNWGWDTMLAAHCLDNRPGICSLKFQSLVKLGVPAYNENIEPFLFGSGHYNRIEEISKDNLLFYGGMDAVLEYRLAMVQRREMGYED